MTWKTSAQRDRELAAQQARGHFNRRIQKLLDKWQAILGVKVHEFQIKKMNVWSSLNPHDRRLWISHALGTMSDAALEYVIVHELVHLLIAEASVESGPGDRFNTLMDRYLPTWRKRYAGMLTGSQETAPRARLDPALQHPRTPK
jgi:predicted metal-dependent hydrolase